MFKKMKQTLKNEKGLTLVELLAVVVILGIITAIAIPSIGGLINNSKKDAHLANGQQMVNSAKLAFAAEGTDEGTKTLAQLIDGDYLEDMKDPSGDKYDHTSSVKITKETDKSYKYEVTLKGATTYYSVKDPFKIKRGDVTLP